MNKYMQVVWLYATGLIIIFIGIFTLISSPGPASFVVMLVGLAIAAIGAAHGRKMRMTGQLDFNGAAESEPGPQPAEPEVTGHDEEEAEWQPEELPPEGDIPQHPTEPGTGSRFSGLFQSFRKAPAPDEIALTQEDILQIEMDDIKGGRIVPTEADIIEFVCPKCGAANEERNFFCFTCGNKLRRKTPNEDEGGTHIKLDPGTIEMVENQRVAKIVICPKCNAPNKVGDKFCWSCGKKIKSDSKEAKAVKDGVSKKEKSKKK